MSSLKILLAQINPHVGDVPGNLEKILQIQNLSQSAGHEELAADLIMFPELTLMGYPPEDLLLRPSVGVRVERALQALLSQQATKGGANTSLLVGYPNVNENRISNMAGVLRAGELIAEYAKQCLPNYQVFDDKRYFAAGDQSCIVEVNGIKLAVLICEDLWEEEPMQKAVAAGGEAILVLNASPFHTQKHDMRCQLLKQRASDYNVPIVYVNQVGGQDELVFDGGSMVFDRKGNLKALAPFFGEALISVELCKNQGLIEVGLLNSKNLQFIDGRYVPEEYPLAIQPPPALDLVYEALVLGVKDYVNKNGFRGVVLGLSGGIDSALTLAVAVDALGKDRVEAVMMPFRYTSQMSQDDAAKEAELLGVRYQSIGIERIYEAFTAALKEEFEGLATDTTEENIQARIRGNILMSISNKKGFLVLTTGNKSELSVGYATLYGDMAGGFDVLKDVPKTMVFELSSYRNSLGAVIPQNVIDRPPSAELAPDQKDEDSLPPYSELDQILEFYVEQDMSSEAIVAKGFDKEIVERVIRLVDINEYKRRQAAIGPRITERGFGRDRRYPITSGWKLGD